MSRFKYRQTNIKLTVSKPQDFAIFEKPIFLESYLIVIPSQVNNPKDYYLFREFVIGTYYQFPLKKTFTKQSFKKIMKTIVISLKRYKF